MMNQEAPNTNENEQDAQFQLILSLGQMLKEGRERCRMTIDDIADHLRITPIVVTNIEADAYQNKELTVYIRGYVRSYARLVNVAESDVQQALTHLGIKNIKKTEQHIKYEEFRPSSQDKHFKLITYLVVASLILLVMLWYYSSHQNENNIVAEPRMLTAEPAMQDLHQDTMPVVSTAVDVQSVKPTKQPSTHPIIKKSQKKDQVIKTGVSQKTVTKAKVPESKSQPWINPDELP